MSDVTERLEKVIEAIASGDSARLSAVMDADQNVLAGPFAGWAYIERLLRDAKAEIEHLRSLAGAVSQGQSFAEIAAPQRSGMRVEICSTHDVPMVRANTSGGQTVSYCPQCAAHGGRHPG